ncbi:N-acetylated-alpha-linked acidic dipeptidase 2-like isoform X3 [Scylla paramamosain]|uniref:N-acetylated-alpha-linked acidic dipeptidase 2-like isoform X3 n=1 Tax=Scylla paramamosain TaxID=85552 RepID=UPI0030828AB6
MDAADDELLPISRKSARYRLSGKGGDCGCTGVNRKHPWTKIMGEGKGTVLSIAAVFQVLVATSVILAVVLWSKQPPDVPAVVLEKCSGDAISASLRHLTSEPHTAGTEADTQQAQWVAEQWRDQGLDTVNLVPYDVLLSYPDTDKTNTLSVKNGSGHVVWESQGRQTPLWPGEDHPGVLPSFNAYSARGLVQGPVVYAFLGRDEDFRYLDDHNVSVSGSIVLVRYGDVFRGNQVLEAEKRGAGGVLLFLDPGTVSPEGSYDNDTYPNTVFAPPHAAQLGTTMMGNGDPLTPFYPSIESAFRIPEDEAAVPKIPVQPLSYSDAAFLLGHMGGPVAPKEWQGGLNLVYRLGPGLQEPSLTTSLSVHTHNANATVYNVVATIRGAVEPDRYVLLGNHRDAWIFGGVDPSSATASMLEVSRLYGLLLQKGWRPRRSLVFCSWAAEEYGLVGSTEWTEQFTTVLQGRAVAYLNVDMVFEGTYSFISMASPLLWGAIVRAARMVPNPDPKEAAAGRPTLHDTWVHRHPNPRHPGRPKFLGLGSGSDFATFQHVLGIPCMDMYYTAAPDAPSLPLYHTLYETFHLARQLYDPDMAYHVALTRTWALVAYFLSHEDVIPFSVSLYGEFLTEALQDLEEEYSSLLNQTQTELGYLRAAVSTFSVAAKNWTAGLASVDLEDAMAVRAANDVQMMLDRAFLDPRGLPGRPHFNHVVMAPSNSNTYTSDSFAGLQDLLHDLPDLPPKEQVTRWRQVREHFAAVTHLIRAAAGVLTQEIW